MYLSLNWLKEFVEIPKEVSPKELSKKLTLHTVEVEKVEYQADKYKGVVIGKILEVKPHPNADRLRLAKVDIGKEKLEIVCGAPNIKAGQFVPVALVGARLSNGTEIKPAEIRGIKSNGMLCAEDELGLGSDHDGIMILEKTPLIPLYKGDKSLLTPLPRGARGVKLGHDFADYLKLNDVIFEVDNKSLTHRADLWSHYGMARDISAFLNVKFKSLKTPLIPLYKGDKKALLSKEGQGRFSISVKIEDFSLCPRYMAVGLEGVTIAPSPKWLADRLSACGLRPINNIVDVTNYVMLELGQPLHAFDKNFIDHIIVRRARAGEIIETLDGQKRKLEPDMLVIADKVKAVAIAGVMGGANSEINNQTNFIIIESANFNFASVRKTAQKLGLRTEASMRFEKGLDPNLCELGLARAVELILKICPEARVAGNLADKKKTPLIPLLKGDGRGLGPIVLDLNWLNKFIGYEFTLKPVKQILEKLGFGVKIKRSPIPSGGVGLLVTVPTWRAVHDVSLKEDLAEEVARIYGYNNLKAELPKINLAPPLVMPEKQLERKIKNILSVGAGLSEVYNYSFLSAADLNKINIELAQAIKLANPLSEDLAWLRPSLAAGLLENIKLNQAKEEFIGLYEIGSIFLNQPGEFNLPFQEKHLGLALAGDGQADLFRKLKGLIEYLLGWLNLAVKFEPWAVISTSASEEKSLKAENTDKGFLPRGLGVEMTNTAVIFVSNHEIGRVGYVDNGLAQAFGLKKKAAMAEIRLTKLFQAIKNSPASQYSEPAKYPPLIRDLAFVVNEKILYNKIKSQLENFSDLIKQADLFDVYQGGQLGAGKKSLAFHIIYQADKTLTSEEVDEVQGKLVKHLEKELGAKIRDF